MSKTKIPKVGVDEHTIPEDLGRPAGEETWWSTQKETPAKKEKKTSKKSKWWTSGSVGSATQEMERFRHIPVVGKLPWHTQYIACAVVLVISLGVLLMFSLSRGADGGPSTVSARQQILAAQHAINQVSQGEQPQDVELTEVLPSSLDSNIHRQWQELKTLTQQAPGFYTTSTAVISAAQNTQNHIGPAIIAAAPLWRQAGEGGEWSSVEAVNFAQVLSEMQYLHEVATRVLADQSDIPERVGVARQNIEQSFRVFASSPSSTQNTALTQAWRALAGGFVAARADLDTLAGNRQSWNNLQGASKVFDVQSNALMAQLNTVDARHSAVASPSTRLIVLGSALAVLLSLAFLIWIAWNQQKWRVLQEQSLNEQLKVGVEELGHQLRHVANGDLTKRVRPSNSLLRPVGEAINSTVKQLQSLVQDVKETAQSTTGAARHAQESTGILVDKTRQQITEVLEDGEKMLSLSSAIQEVINLSEQANHAALSSVESITLGQKTSSDIREKLEGIQQVSEEGGARSQRIQQSIMLIAQNAIFLNEVAEQMSVLSIQASLQAVKAGESGQGFRVVADGLKALSERSSEGSRRLATIAETVVSDVDFVADAWSSLDNVTEQTIELSEVAQETDLSLHQKITVLKETVQEIKDISGQQEQSANDLSAKTEANLKTVEQTSQKAQEAAESLVLLLNSVEGLDHSTLRFKVDR